MVRWPFAEAGLGEGGIPSPAPLRIDWPENVVVENEGERSYPYSVNVKDIREMRDIAPFKPFDLHLTSGRTLAVNTPDHLLFSPRGDLLVLFPPDGGVCVIDPAQVATLDISNRQK